MVAEELLPMVPAVAVNAPMADPVMFRLTGTGNSPLLLLRFTVAVPVGTAVSVTVQVVICAVPSAFGAQLAEDNSTATSVKLEVCDTPLAVAVSTAV